MHRFFSVVATLGALSAIPAAAQTASLKPLDVFQLALVSDPQISPDGRHILYVRQFADIMGDRRHSNLWIVNFDGTDNRPLTTGNFNDTAPRWSPDGTQIIYISNRDGSPQIYRRWMDTGQIAKLTNLQNPPSGIAWSPDGKWVSYAALVTEAAPKIATLPTPPEGAKWADPPKIIDRLVYRFNGSGYLKPGYSHLFVVPAEGGAVRQISHGNFFHTGPYIRASDAVWTPDGQYLIVSTNRHADFETDPLNTEVYEFRVSDGSVRALTSRKGPDSSPAIAPDGRHIAYLGFDDRYQGYQVSQLYIMNRDGSNPRSVTASLDRDANAPHWAPDGSGVYFFSDDQGDTGLYFVPLDGAPKKLAAHIGSTANAGGGASGFSIARNGNFTVTQTRPDMPGDIAAGNLANPSPRIITAVNQGLLSARRLGATEEIWYESSKDKRKIEAWIVKPPDFNASKKYPLIIEIHGGPFANYGDRFDLEKQLMAAAGYVVLYTNPRGSTSYGGEFGNLIHHAYPGDDFYDLNSGVDAVIAKGYVDPSQLFVTGGSGGGVLTCWMIGHTARFRAAAPLYPVINWYSFVLTSDIGPFASRYWFPGMPWDNAEHYEKRSLLSVVKNVKTPTMIMTGEADFRTPISDSEQYYQALKLLGVETVLVRVPEEPHGVSQRPSHQMAKVANIIAWFDKHRQMEGSPAPTVTSSH